MVEKTWKALQVEGCCSIWAMAAKRSANESTVLDTDEGKLSLLQISDEQFEIGYQMLEDFRDNVQQWYFGFTACPEALASGELDICMFDTGMAYDAYRDNLAVNICWTCGVMVFTDQMSVINGTSLDPELFELVQLAMGWMSLPEVHPLASQYIGYGPVNEDSLEYMDDPICAVTSQFLPTSPQNFPFAVFTDEIYDGSINVEQDQRWEAFLLGAPLGLE